MVWCVAVGERRVGAMSTISSSQRSITSHLLIWKKERKEHKNGGKWTVIISVIPASDVIFYLDVERVHRNSKKMREEFLAFYLNNILGVFI